jgi:hypothetical protein
VDETRRIAGGPTRKLGSSSFVADWAIERPSDASPPSKRDPFTTTLVLAAPGPICRGSRRSRRPRDLLQLPNLLSGVPAALGPCHSPSRRCPNLGVFCPSLASVRRHRPSARIAEQRSEPLDYRSAVSGRVLGTRYS